MATKPQGSGNSAYTRYLGTIQAPTSNSFCASWRPILFERQSLNHNVRASDFDNFRPSIRQEYTASASLKTNFWTCFMRFRNRAPWWTHVRDVSKSILCDVKCKLGIWDSLKNHIKLLRNIRKFLYVFLNIKKFDGGFSVKLECSEGKVSLEQGYALKKIIPLSQCGPTCVLHAMVYQGDKQALILLGVTFVIK